MDDGKRIKLQLWDTAGQEKFRSITKSYYRNSVGVILVYDIGNHDSFAHIPLWMDEANRHIDPHKPSFALIGCKIDLPEREVSLAEAADFAALHGMPHAETSAKTGAGVESAFRALAKMVHWNLIPNELSFFCFCFRFMPGFNLESIKWRTAGMALRLVLCDPMEWILILRKASLRAAHAANCAR